MGQAQQGGVEVEGGGLLFRRDDGVDLGQGREELHQLLLAFQDAPPAVFGDPPGVADELKGVADPLLGVEQDGLVPERGGVPGGLGEFPLLVPESEFIVTY